jgi:DNA polymerase-3 subunit delta'
MNVKAQNALLISLEEPPKNVLFFLLTTDAGALLETIRSRAQTLRTELLDNEIIFNHLKEIAPLNMTDERLEEIVIASGGSLGYATDLLNPEKSKALIEARERALNFALAVIKNDTDAVTHLLSYSYMQREELKELLALCVTVIGDLILLKKDKSAPLRFFTSRDNACELAQKHNLPKLISCYDALLVAISDLNMNSNTALALMSILINSKKKGS